MNRIYLRKSSKIFKEKLYNKKKISAKNVRRPSLGSFFVFSKIKFSVFHDFSYITSILTLFPFESLMELPQMTLMVSLILIMLTILQD